MRIQAIPLAAPGRGHPVAQRRASPPATPRHHRIEVATTLECHPEPAGSGSRPGLEQIVTFRPSRFPLYHHTEV
jgi:hypothetical protein